MRTFFAERKADVTPLSYLIEIPRIRRKPIRHLKPLSASEPHENLRLNKHLRANQSAKYSTNLLQLLWTLVVDFGGEARCIDLNGRMRQRYIIQCSDEESLESIRGEIGYLEASGKLTLEALGTEVLVARTTPSGVALALSATCSYEISSS